jgi:hypothetical protein
LILEDVQLEIGDALSDQGNVRAKKNLEALYTSGKGVQKDE